MLAKPARHSFAYKSALQFFEKLQDEYLSLVADPLSSRHAVNFAMTAWHLADWTWAQNLQDAPKEQFELYGRRFKDFNSYKLHLTLACPDLKIIQAICNGSKHVDTSSQIGRTFKKTPSGRGAKQLLVVEIKGQEYDFADISKRVYQFWTLKVMPRYARAVKLLLFPERTQKQFASRDPDEPVSFGGFEKRSILAKWGTIWGTAKRTASASD
jgi:hypothetical protein